MRSLVLAFSALLLGTILGQPAARADGPRLAIVVSGDPSEAAVSAATRLGDALALGAEVVQPSDPAVIGALRGAPGTSADGLDELRGFRRRLGLGTDTDREVLDALAARLELVAIVVVKGATSPTARVYDPGQHRLFTGEAPLASTDAAELETARAFVVARAQAAQRRHDAPPPDAAAATTAPDAAPSPSSPTEEPPPRRSFMRRNWPFFVAGALLAGVTTYFIVQRRNDSDTSPPVIHIRPGGN